MNVHVRASFTLFLSILSPPPRRRRPPHPCCPCHHRATVEVVSGRGMMPNLTGVEPYLYSLHSRFCLKGFVYTRPINHLLPSHNPTAFKVGARPEDNAQHRCQCKSLSSPVKEGNEDFHTSGHLLLSGCFIIFLLTLPLALITILTKSPQPRTLLITKHLDAAHMGTESFWFRRCHPPPPLSGKSGAD